MSKSELADRDSTSAARGSDGQPPPAATSLLTAQPDARCLVVAIGANDLAALAREGISAGAEVSVERLVGLGGPVIVRVGRARLALARRVARTVLVEPRP